MIGGLAVMAGDVAALESAVDCSGDVRRCLASVCNRVGNRRMRAQAAGGTDIEVRQRAFKEPRDLRANTVRVPQQRKTMPGLDAFQLCSQRSVVRLPVVFPASGPLFRRGRMARPVERFATEKMRWAQLGVGRTGVHGRVVGWAVQVNHITRKIWPQDTGTQRRQKVVQLVQVPVGVFHLERLRGVGVLKLRRDGSADMGHADQQGRGTAVQGKTHTY